MDRVNYCKSFLVAAIIALPFNISAETSIGQDVQKVVNSTGKGIEKIGDKIEEAAKDTKQYASDAAITTAVKAKIAAAADIPSDISVTTTDGIVHLKGNVDTGLQADKASSIAASVNGVKNVNTSGISVTESKSYFSDAMITAKAKAKIMGLDDDDKIADSNLQVETTNGVVHIFGTVGNKGDKDTIIEAVKEIKGVSDVQTNIDVEKKSD